MAENTYKIVVSLDGGGTEPGEAPTPEDAKPSKPNKKEPTSYEKFQKGGLKVIATAGTVLNVANFANTLKMQELNIVTGQTQLAQLRQAQMSVASGALSLGGSMITGGAIASWLGATGPVGLALGAASYVGQKTLDVITKANEMRLKKYVEDEQLQVLRSRAGASFNRSRLNN